DDVEAPRRPFRIRLRRHRREPLHALAAAIGVTERPPLNGDVGEKGGERQRDVVGRGEEVETPLFADGGETRRQIPEAADLVQRVERDDDSTDEREDELKEVRGDDAPESTERRVHEHERRDRDYGPESLIGTGKSELLPEAE